MESKHTNGIWEVVEFKNHACIFSRQATKSVLLQGHEDESHRDMNLGNLSHIVNCVNSHDELVKALTKLVEMTRFVEDNTEKGCGYLAALQKAESVLNKVTNT